MKDELAKQLNEILLKYDPDKPKVVADELRNLWLQYEPKSIEVIKAELREQQETIGIPVPILKSIAGEISRVARNQVDSYMQLIQLLWNEYGREGRVVASVPLGAMELSFPENCSSSERNVPNMPHLGGCGPISDGCFGANCPEETRRVAGCD